MAKVNADHAEILRGAERRLRATKLNKGMRQHIKLSIGLGLSRRQPGLILKQAV
jgi:hypothetical protein